MFFTNRWLSLKKFRTPFPVDDLQGNLWKKVAGAEEDFSAINYTKSKEKNVYCFYRIIQVMIGWLVKILIFDKREHPKKRRVLWKNSHFREV